MSDAHDWRPLYPFASHHVSLDGVRYHYLDEGQGSPLVMVHGNPTWSFYWRNLVLGLRDRFRTIVPDHIGCGLSDKPADYPYRLSQHIANLRQLIERLDLRDITLLVHDWGGAIGLGTAIERPERFARIVLFNTGAFPPPYVPLRIRACRTPWLGTWALRRHNAFARAAIRMAMHHHDRMTPAVRAGLLAPYDSWDHRVAIDGFVRDIPFTRRHPTWQTLADIERRLPTFAGLPVRIFWGERDWCFTRVCLDRFRVLFPHAEIDCFADAGHYVLEDAHERIVPRLRTWLGAEPLETPA